jgi:glycosyltransferase involved in cell wall biosynthesis
MKILHIITGLGNGGAEAILWRLISYDNRKNIQHEVVSLSDLGYYGEPLLNRGIKVHALKFSCNLNFIIGVIQLFKLLRTIKPDVVQTWMYHADVLGGTLAWLNGGSKILWGIHNSNLDSRKTKFFTRLMAYLSAALSWLIPVNIICCSKEAADKHIKLGYCSKKIIVIHNGVNVTEFQPNKNSRQNMRAKLGVRSEDYLLGMVARWDMQKDHPNLFAALGALKKRGIKHWKCILVGSGMTISNEAIIALLRKFDILECVDLLGSISNIAEVMNSLDLHILPSSGEAFGNVTIEAMACGVPCIVTSVGAGQIITGQTGWVIEPSNPSILSYSIENAFLEMSNSKSWNKRKNKCRERVEMNFSLSKMVDEYHAAWRINGLN